VITGAHAEPFLYSRSLHPNDAYGIYYHKLALDHRGRLFVSLSYLSGYELTYPIRPGRYFQRTVLASDDAGSTWRIATTADFSAGILS